MDMQTLFQFFLIQEHTQTLQIKRGFTPLMSACENGHEEIVHLLISSCAVNINAQNEDGWSVIYIASSNGHAGIVSILLNSGANPHTADKKGLTPIDISLQKWS